MTKSLDDIGDNRPATIPPWLHSASSIQRLEFPVETATDQKVPVQEPCLPFAATVKFQVPAVA